MSRSTAYNCIIAFAFSGLLALGGLNYLGIARPLPEWVPIVLVVMIAIPVGSHVENWLNSPQPTPPQPINYQDLGWTRVDEQSKHIIAEHLRRRG